MSSPLATWLHKGIAAFLTNENILHMGEEHLMKIVKKDGKTYLVGTANEVGNVLTKIAHKNDPVDLGWTLSKQADDASELDGKSYVCKKCSFNGHDALFVGGSCPKCGGRDITQS